MLSTITASPSASQAAELDEDPVESVSQGTETGAQCRSNWKARLRHRWSDRDSGQSMTEYSLLAGLVAVSISGLAPAISKDLRAILFKLTTVLGLAAGTGPMSSCT